MEGVLADSPTVDALRLAAAMRRRFPRKFHPYIEMALWESLADYYAGTGGTSLPDGHLHILVDLSPILAICPMREMALLC
jgi:hypothetical protein